jgi:1-deoxy-D-xylulose-5-phosphate reductoisomerase
MTFLAPDMEKFRCLALAFQALETGGTAPAVLNAANEVAVEHFLGGRIRFSTIPALIEEALARHQAVAHPALDDIIHADGEARASTQQHITAVSF